MSQDQDNKGSTRREFIRNAALTATVSVAASQIAKSSVYSLAPAKVLGANDKIIIGHVGVGMQGTTHVRLLHDNATDGLKNNTDQVAVCDLYVRRRKEAAAILNINDSGIFADHRKLLENKDIDAVWVTTSDQWHADVALDAMEAGKHVYIEKPMCKTVEQAYKLYDTAKKTKRVVQVGVQGTSTPIYHNCADLIKNGQYGTRVMGQASYCRNSKEGEWNIYPIDPGTGPQATGDNYVDWNTFRRGTKPVEWVPDRFFRWRKWWDYGTGLVGDLLPHRLYPMMIALNIPQDDFQGFPTRVASCGGLYVQKYNAQGKVDRHVPDFVDVITDFEGGPSLMLMTTCINEEGWTDMVRMNKATLTLGGDTIMVKPERVWADQIDGTEVSSPSEDRIDVHERNFLDAIRGVVPEPNCNINLALRGQIILSLAVLSYRNNAEMNFDPKTRKYWPGSHINPATII